MAWSLSPLRRAHLRATARVVGYVIMLTWLALVLAAPAVLLASGADDTASPPVHPSTLHRDLVRRGSPLSAAVPAFPYSGFQRFPAFYFGGDERGDQAGTELAFVARHALAGWGWQQGFARTKHHGEKEGGRAAQALRTHARHQLHITASLPSFKMAPNILIRDVFVCAPKVPSTDRQVRGCKTRLESRTVMKQTAIHPI